MKVIVTKFAHFLKRPCGYKFATLLYKFFHGCFSGPEVKAQCIFGHPSHSAPSLEPKQLIYSFRSKASQDIAVLRQK